MVLWERSSASRSQSLRGPSQSREAPLDSSSVSGTMVMRTSGLLLTHELGEGAEDARVVVGSRKPALSSSASLRCAWNGCLYSHGATPAPSLKLPKRMMPDRTIVRNRFTGQGRAAIGDPRRVLLQDGFHAFLASSPPPRSVLPHPYFPPDPLILEVVREELLDACTREGAISRYHQEGLEP